MRISNIISYCWISQLLRQSSHCSLSRITSLLLCASWRLLKFMYQKRLQVRRQGSQQRNTRETLWPLSRMHGYFRAKAISTLLQESSRPTLTGAVQCRPTSRRKELEQHRSSELPFHYIDTSTLCWFSSHAPQRRWEDTNHCGPWLKEHANFETHHNFLPLTAHPGRHLSLHIPEDISASNSYYLQLPKE